MGVSHNAKRQHAIVRALGITIRELRRKQGLTLRGLADLTNGNVTHRQIDSYEQAQRTMRVVTLDSIAKALGVETSALWDMAELTIWMGSSPVVTVNVRKLTLNQDPRFNAFRRWVGMHDKPTKSIGLGHHALQSLAKVMNMSTKELQHALIDAKLTE